MYFGALEFAKLVPWVTQFGYWGAAGVLFVEGLSVPFPGGTFLLFYGFLASQGKISLPLAILSASLGYTVAGTLPYLIGKIGGRPLILKWGPYVGLSHRRFGVTERWFHRFGIPVVAFGRLLFFRNYVSYFAGIARIPTRSFYFYTWIGILPWATYMTLLGYLLGNNWRFALTLAQKYSWIGVTVVAALVILGYFLLRSGVMRRLNKWLGNI